MWGLDIFQYTPSRIVIVLLRLVRGWCECHNTSPRTVNYFECAWLSWIIKQSLIYMHWTYSICCINNLTLRKELLSPYQVMQVKIWDSTLIFCAFQSDALFFLFHFWWFLSNWTCINLPLYLGEENGNLGWELRVHIALDVARGLEYLHDGVSYNMILTEIIMLRIL
jgi:hypothetical protein